LAGADRESLAACRWSLGLATCGRRAQRQNAARYQSPGRLPSRGEFVVRHAYILTMDPTLGDIADGDVHVKHGEIVAVGKALTRRAPSTSTAATAIVLAGADRHAQPHVDHVPALHGGDRTEDGYFPVTTATVKP